MRDTTIGTYDLATDPRRLVCAIYGCEEPATYRSAEAVPTTGSQPVFYGYCAAHRDEHATVAL